LGAEITWQQSAKQMDAGLATAALLQAGFDDDKSVSSNGEVPALTYPAAEKSAATTDGLAPVAAADAAAAAAVAAPDPTNFLTWTHKNWNEVPFDLISFPSGQTPLKTRTYYAVALIFLNKV
jgi:hypothetical protein